ncbi:glycosyltransferase family 4 protein [Rubrivirga sp.]|uniref:glycosyltransferase family 4 protein n=1 Tax=Rubrivirga sp. TaxID=1885344 RepID=UPI003B51F24D
MTLLFVLPEYPPDYGGGIATYYGALLPELVRQGHMVDVIVGSAFTSGSRAYEHEGVSVRMLEGERTERLMPAYNRYAATPEVQRHLAASRALWEQAEGGAGYDVVETVDWGLLFASWAAEGQAPVRVRMAGSSGQISTYDAFPGKELAGELLRLLESSLLPAAHALHSTSRANVAFWERTAGRPVTYAPPPVVPREPLGGPRRPEGFVAARVQEWKGPQVLAEALRHLGTDAPVVEWAGRVIAHPRTREPYDRVLRREYPEVWGPRVQMIGRISPDEVAQRQATAAFVVVPSLWDVYNFSATEAMLQEAVLICSDGAGGVDLVEDGENAFVVPAGDATALAGRIAEVVAMAPQDRARVGRAARETALRLTDPARVAAASAASYADLVGSASPPPSPWIRDAVRPGAAVDLGGFLSHLPLRRLLAHAAGRLRAKTPFARAHV